jgi:hypothetical protein
MVFLATTAALIPSTAGSRFVSADEGLPPKAIPTSVVELFEVDSGLIWLQVDAHTIEVSMPD